MESKLVALCLLALQAIAYELHAVNFGSSADQVFAALDRHPFVAGEFVWTGFDYLGEPTPYDASRSSYSGIIDLAGFKKDRFYLYQSRWRPGLPMAHLLSHRTWPERVGQVTPVHVFTSGDEAELVVNGRSQGRRKKGHHEYRRSTAMPWSSCAAGATAPERSPCVPRQTGCRRPRWCCAA